MKILLKSFAILFVVVAGFVLLTLENQIGGWRAFIVKSASMEPAIKTGSLVITKYTAPSTLQMGDIITFIAPLKSREFVTHRITQLSTQNKTTAIKTKGDSNPASDSWILAGGGVVGKVFFVIPYLGFLFSFTQTKIGILLLVLLPAAYIIFGELQNILQMLKHRSKKEIIVQEVAVLGLFMILGLGFVSKPTYAFLSDQSTLNENSFSVGIPTSIPTNNQCTGNTNININANGTGSQNNVTVTNTCETTVNQNNNTKSVTVINTSR